MTINTIDINIQTTAITTGMSLNTGKPNNKSTIRSGVDQPKIKNIDVDHRRASHFSPKVTDIGCTERTTNAPMVKMVNPDQTDRMVGGQAGRYGPADRIGKEQPFMESHPFLSGLILNDPNQTRRSSKKKESKNKSSKKSKDKSSAKPSIWRRMWTKAKNCFANEVNGNGKRDKNTIPLEKVISKRK